MIPDQPNTVRAELVEAPLREPSLTFGRLRLDRLRTNGILCLALLAIPLASCGLSPMYSGGAKGAVASTLSSVSVEPIEGKAGWLVRNALTDRLTAASKSAETRYSLRVVLDDKIEGFGVRADDTITRERRSLRARYQLVDNASGTVVVDATAGSDVGIDVVSSEYATIAAENTALENLAQKISDQIVARLSLYARNMK